MHKYVEFSTNYFSVSRVPRDGPTIVSGHSEDQLILQECDTLSSTISGERMFKILTKQIYLILDNIMNIAVLHGACSVDAIISNTTFKITVDDVLGGEPAPVCNLAEPTNDLIASEDSENLGSTNGENTIDSTMLVLDDMDSPGCTPIGTLNFVYEDVMCRLAAILVPNISFVGLHSAQGSPTFYLS